MKLDNFSSAISQDFILSLGGGASNCALLARFS